MKQQESDGMKRREFSLTAAAAVVPGLMGVRLASAQAPKPKEGKDYLALEKRAPTDAPAGKIEVIEFFWYSCPHCNAFEPTLDAWVKALPKDVSFKRVPVAFRDDFAPQQRLYYTLEALNKVDELHRKVFQAVHGERLPLTTDDAIIAWAEKQGLDKAKFTEVYRSFTVASKMRRATQLQDAYKVEGVPALGIAGRYYTDGSLAGSMERVLGVTDSLVAEVRKSR
jgi:protein dithiol oxidoreductase (disulfide-forming)